MSSREEEYTSPTRKITAILFADIVGYTALMQSNEQLALSTINKFKQTLDTKVPACHGEIIQYYGDGCLAIFNSSVDAATCAKSMQEIFQEEPKVPVRIGLHAGDVVLREGNIFGNAVNVASRIESSGVAGSVLFSKTVKDQIKNQQGFLVKSLGEFEFKNVEQPMELFALANKGFAVPKREEMQGKLKSKTTPSDNNFFSSLWAKRIPRGLLIYFVSVWIAWQVLDWALPQFGISLHWTKIFLIIAVGILPSLLVYFSNRGRITLGQLKRREKILFPSNLLLLGTVLFFLFRTADLGAITQNITFTNPEGETETHNIVKEEFQIQIPIFPADPIQVDSVNLWIGLSYPPAVGLNLSLNKYLFPVEFRLPRSRMNANYSKVEKISLSKIYRSDFYIDGTYRVIGEQFEFTPAIRNKKTGEIIKEKIFLGNDLFDLVDSISNFLLQNIGLRQDQIEETLDLPTREIFTDNFEAAKQYCLGLVVGDFGYRIDKAIELDSNFAQAYFVRSQVLTNNSINQLEAKAMIDKAMKFRKKLPLPAQISIMIYKHLAYEEWEKAEQLLNIQLELDPNNELYHRMLLNIYFKTGQIEKAIAHAERRFVKNPNPFNGMAAMRALLMKGEPKKVISRVNTFLLLDPHNALALKVLAEAYIHNEDFEKARATVEKIILTKPETKENLSHFLRAIDYMKTNKIKPEDLKKYSGNFRDFEIGKMYSHRLISNQLFAKHPQERGAFLYPDSDSTLTYSTPTYFEKIEFFHGMENTSLGLKVVSKRRTDYYWKQDSLIWQAEDLIWNRDYENAREVYQKAIEKHPGHYYLHVMNQHLEYLLSKSEEEIQQNFQRLVGQYEETKIWIEDGLLYYRRPGISRKIFRPISDHQFATLGNISMSYKFVENNGEIIALEGYEFDHEKMEWVKYEPVNYKRTKLLD